MAKTLSLGNAPAPTTLADTLRAILAEVTPDTRPYSGDSYLPDHLIDAARLALAQHEQQDTASQQQTEVAQALEALRRANAMHLTGSTEAAIDLERKARLILVGLLQANGVDTASQQHAHNALSTAAWHIARGEAPQALARLRRAQSHIKASMEGAAA